MAIEIHEHGRGNPVANPEPSVSRNASSISERSLAAARLGGRVDRRQDLLERGGFPRRGDIRDGRFEAQRAAPYFAEQRMRVPRARFACCAPEK